MTHNDEKKTNSFPFSIPEILFLSIVLLSKKKNGFF